jgi:hypothetical protein
MTIDTYGLSFEKYKEIFHEEATRIFNLYVEFSAACDKTDMKLSEKTKYDLFSETVYAANDDARKRQRKENPDTFKEETLDFISPSREELLEEIRSLHAKVEALTDYLADLVLAFKEGVTEILDTTEGKA